MHEATGPAEQPAGPVHVFTSREPGQGIRAARLWRGNLSLSTRLSLSGVEREAGRLNKRRRLGVR